MTELIYFFIYESLCVVATACRRSCGNVMFFHMSVSYSVHREAVYASMHLSRGCVYPSIHLGRGCVYPLGTPLPRDGSGWYASYWDAFLLLPPA